MPARAFRRPPQLVAVAGAPPPDAIMAGLSLLAMFGNTTTAKQAKSTLEAMQAAAKANSAALQNFGPAERIVDLAEQAEADRAEAAARLAEAKSEADRLVAEAEQRAEGQREELEAERHRLVEAQKALETRIQEQDEREANFADETASLRRALAG